MGLLQEKFQVEFPEPSQDNQWVTPESARTKARPPSFASSDTGCRGYLNDLPPGDTISDQMLAPSESLPMVMSGETDVTKDWNPEAVSNGYKRFTLRPTDDSYTAEHVDTFYGEAVSDGETGFAERGNLLDRI